MESKLWACKTLQLVCTMRVDIRLSKLLLRYQQTHREVERTLEQAGSVQANRHRSSFMLKPGSSKSLLELTAVVSLFAQLLLCRHYCHPSDPLATTRLV